MVRIEQILQSQVPALEDSFSSIILVSKFDYKYNGHPNRCTGSLRKSPPRLKAFFSVCYLCSTCDNHLLQGMLQINGIAATSDDHDCLGFVSLAPFCANCTQWLAATKVDFIWIGGNICIWLARTLPRNPRLYTAKLGLY